MNIEFTKLVIALREAQRNFDEVASDRDKSVGAHQLRRLEQLKKAAEQKVDAYIQQYFAERAQLDLWTRSVKGSEQPGAYNMRCESKENEKAGA